MMQPSASGTRYRLESTRWPGAWWVLGWDQAQQTYYAQLYGPTLAHVRAAYPEWMHVGSPTGTGVEYGPDYPALTAGDGEWELTDVDDLATAIAEDLPVAFRAQLEADQAAGADRA